MKYINKQTTNFKDNDQQDQRHLDSKNQMNQPFGFQQLPIVNNNFANTTKRKTTTTTTTTKTIMVSYACDHLYCFGKLNNIYTIMTKLLFFFKYKHSSFISYIVRLDSFRIHRRGPGVLSSLRV